MQRAMSDGNSRKLWRTTLDTAAGSRNSSMDHKTWPRFMLHLFLSRAAVTFWLPRPLDLDLKSQDAQEAKTRKTFSDKRLLWSDWHKPVYSQESRGGVTSKSCDQWLCVPCVLWPRSGKQRTPNFPWKLKDYQHVLFQSSLEQRISFIAKTAWSYISLEVSHILLQPGLILIFLPLTKSIFLIGTPTNTAICLAKNR